MKQILILASALGALLLGSAAYAAPITYSFSYVNGADNANGTITTDGTIGVIGTANVLSWNIFLAPTPGTTFTLTNGNSQLGIVGSNLVGSASALTFNFGAGGYALFQNPSIGSGINFLCYAGSLCGGFTNAINWSTSSFGAASIASQGRVTVATARTSVPEPATLGMLALGLFGLAAARRRQNAR